MNLPREVVVDLLPLYAAGELSPVTRELIEAALRVDRELSEQLRMLETDSREPGVNGPSLDVEIESLRRTRRRLALHRWLFAIGIAGLAIGLSIRLEVRDGRATGVALMLVDHPVVFSIPLAIGIACLVAYHRLRTRYR